MTTALSYSQIAGANDRVALGLIGCGGRGSYVAKLFQKNPSLRIAAVCDVYGARIDAALAFAKGARSFYHHEKLIEMRELDAVVGARDLRIGKRGSHGTDSRTLSQPRALRL